MPGPRKAPDTQSPAGDEIQLGQIVVTLSESLGKGSFGEVFKASDHRGEVFAVKQMNMEDGDKNEKAAKRELDNFLKIQHHPNLVKMISHHNARGSLWIVMEFCDLKSLDEFVLNNQPSLGTKASLMRDMAKGVNHLHTQKTPVIHRDLKPANTVIKSDRGRPTAKITDFSISKIRDPSKAYTSSTVGTKQEGTQMFMAPESIRKEKCTASVDIFGLGLVFLAVLKGKSKTIDGRQLLIPEAEAECYSPDVPIGMAMSTLMHSKSNPSPLCKTDIPGASPKEITIRKLIVAMTNFDKNRRLTAKQVTESLLSFDGNHEENGTVTKENRHLFLPTEIDLAALLQSIISKLH